MKRTYLRHTMLAPPYRLMIEYRWSIFGCIIPLTFIVTEVYKGDLKDNAIMEFIDEQLK